MHTLWTGIDDVAVMVWETFRALVFGFGVSAARNAYQQEAAFIPALAFMFASTTLFIELVSVLWILIGRRFVFAEVIGAFVLVAFLWTLVRLFFPTGLEQEARTHASADEGGDRCHHESGEPARRQDTGRWDHLAVVFVMDVISFICTDLLILPLILIYRKDYGGRVAFLSGRDFLPCHGRGGNCRGPVVRSIAPASGRAEAAEHHGTHSIRLELRDVAGSGLAPVGCAEVSEVFSLSRRRSVGCGWSPS